jgi:thymidylate synthase
MTNIVVHDLQLGYRQVVAEVIEFGEPVAPRGRPTRELRGVEIIVQDPSRTLPMHVGRKVNSSIAAVEALQLIGGVLHPELLTNASDAFREFMDGGTFHGGYGQRVRSQLPIAVRRLVDDPDTRQAVVTIWDPVHDLFVEGVRDYPCTISLHFLIRNELLELHTHMRSNDVWRGLAYDAFVFTQLQQAVARSLGREAGPYHHHAVSLHLYADDLNNASAMFTYPPPLREPFTLGALVDTICDFSYVMKIARAILMKRSVEEWSHLVNPDVIGWYEGCLP